MSNLLILFFSFTLLLASLTGRLDKYVTILALQGFILFLLVMSNAAHMDILTIIFITVETLGFKTLAFPIILNYLLRKNDLTREMSADIKTFFSLIITSIIIVFGFFLAYKTQKISPSINTLYFGVSVATILTALFLILTRKKVITHVMGYLMLENGIFLLSLAVAKEMPFLVSAGVLLDIFLAVLLLGIFVNQLGKALKDFDIDELSNLKD